MKKKKSSSARNRMRSFVESKGFYIALFSLILLVGFSIYARKIQLDNNRESLAFDDAAWETALEESGIEFKGISPSDTHSVSSADGTAINNEETSAGSTREDVEALSVSAKMDNTPTIEVTAAAVPHTNPDEMQMPCNGTVTEECFLEDLVYCSTTDDWRTHNGMDIAAAEGEPVMAAAAGTVSRVYEDELLGIVVTIDHGDGITSLYGNLQSTDFIHTGTIVQKGDIIGGIGKPGALEADKEPHVHFEVYKDGELKNPSDFITS